MIGVVAHQGRQIKSSGKPGLSLREQIPEALVGIFGGAESGELPHGPQAPAMHCGMNAARVRRLAGIAKIAVWIPARKIGWRVQPLNWEAGNRGELGLALWIFRQRRRQRLLLPRFLFA